MKNPLHRRKRSSSVPLPLLPNDFDRLIRKIIFPAGVDYDGHQLICICACHFPSPRTIPYDTLLPLLLESIDSYVTAEYTLVFFAGAVEHKPSMTWTLSAYQSLGRKYRKGIKKLFVVHSGTWTRIVLEVAGRVVSPKFARKIKYVGTLSELAEYVPLTQINIPPAVYVCNQTHEQEIILPSKYDTFRTRLFGMDLSRVMGPDGTQGLPRVIVDAIAYLRSEGLGVEGLFRVSPSQNSLHCAIDAYDRGHPVDLRDYGPHVAASLIKQFISMLPMPIFPAHIYPALTKFSTIPETEHNQFIQDVVFAQLDPCVVILLSAVIGLLSDVSTSSVTKMSALNLAIVITLTLLHHPHDPLLDAQLSNPNQNGGAALLVIHLITHHDSIFPDKPLPPPPMPPRPSSTPPTTPTRQRHLSSKYCLSEERPLQKKTSTVRLVSSPSPSPSFEEDDTLLTGVPTTSLSTPSPSAEFGSAGKVRGKGRVPVIVGGGVVEELRRVYEERCRIVRTQEPGRKDSGLKGDTSRGGMGVGIGRVGSNVL